LDNSDSSGTVVSIGLIGRHSHLVEKAAAPGGCPPRRSAGVMTSRSHARVMPTYKRRCWSTSISGEGAMQTSGRLMRVP